jgi:mRNA-degrading endonuclease RelE of RelBE toxin-antitoxin system
VCGHRNWVEDDPSGDLGVGFSQVLAVNPTVTSKARIKRLRRPAPTKYRLSVGEFRVFYDVEDETVLVIQVLSKLDSPDYVGGGFP